MAMRVMSTQLVLAAVKLPRAAGGPSPNRPPAPRPSPPHTPEAHRALSYGIPMSMFSWTLPWTIQACWGT